MTEHEIKEIERQLSHPKGQNGIEIGEKMNDSNIGMTKNSIQALDLALGNTVLEIGHGNCGHLEYMLNASSGISYFGLEISETMHSEAKRLNANVQAEFKLYDGEHIPYENEVFDRIMTVNTIYFWSNPEKLLGEIERTLKIGGFFVLTFADKSFMQNLPFVGEKFSLFDKDDIRSLVQNSSLEVVEFISKEDTVMSKVGDTVLRKYTIAKLRKGSG